jgi:hypothetical protein
MKNLIGSGKGKSKMKKGVAVAGMAIAGAAGVAAAARYLRNDRGAATFRVLEEDGGGWSVMAEGDDKPVSSYPTKRKAVAAARKAAGQAAPSELIIHRSDGTVERSHSYASA